jgi:hypothetical protein
MQQKEIYMYCVQLTLQEIMSSRPKKKQFHRNDIFGKTITLKKDMHMRQINNLKRVKHYWRGLKTLT